jgi:DNA repair photolyase
VRPKADILQRLRRDLRRIQAGEDEDFRRFAGMWVTVSNSSDPYSQLPAADEAELQLTRRALELLAGAKMPVLIVTKSPLVARDVDLLDASRSALTMTITTLDAGLAARMEPFAPPPADRLAGLRQCAEAGIGVGCRMDPIIPGLNDSEDGWRRLCEALATAGARQVISSTLKLQARSGTRYRDAFPTAATASESLYGPRGKDGYRRMLPEVARSLMSRLKMVVEEHGMRFSVCREGMADLNTAPCDGHGLAERFGS